MKAIVLLFICLLGYTLAQQSYTVTTTSKFTNDGLKYGSCSCLQNYTCTSTSGFTGTVSFNDPIPSGNYEVTSITIGFTGDPYCGGSFKLYLAVNNYAVNPLTEPGSYNCGCHCYTVKNTTNFENGFSQYNRYGVNTITTTVAAGTVSCYSGYNITLTYAPISTPPPPAPSHSPSPSPVSAPPPSQSNLQCCVYVGTGGAYDVTCTNSPSCVPESGMNLVAHYPVSDCTACFS